MALGDAEARAATLADWERAPSARAAHPREERTSAERTLAGPIVENVRMNLADRAIMTAAEFLSWSGTLPEGRRYELVSGEPIAMAAERNRHNLVKTACCRALEDGVRAAGLDCTVLGDGATVVVSDDDVYEPDVTVQCGEPIDLDATTVPHPMMLVEVLSPSTQGMDAGGKLYGYFQLPSVEHYLILDPAKHVIIHHYRSGSGIGTALLREGVVKLDPPIPAIEFEVAACFRTVL